MNTLGGLSDNLNWMLKIEPLYYVQGITAFVEHDFTGWYPWVLVIAGLVCGVAGLVVFNRRDLPTV
jgi:glycerol uptake facilitator-like aquaporin